VSDPPVSVLLPTYNQVPFAAEAIESAIEQDYANLQVVVGDDGSTDGTAELVAWYAERFPSRVLAIVGEPHVGITANCNRVLARCTGDYLAFHAGDDLFLPGKIRRQVEWLESSPQRVLCGHDVEVMDEQGRIMYLWSRLAHMTAGTGARKLVEQSYLYPGVSLMVRAAARPSSGYDARLPVVSDWLFFIDCLAGGGTYGHIEGAWARYRRHSGNITQVDPQQMARREVIRTDLLVTLALVEAKYPSLVDCARTGRATIFAREGAWYLSRGAPIMARRFLWAGLRQSLTTSRLGLVGLLATYLPHPVLRVAVAWAARRRLRF
jgi:glycosyltransferase involved in cell wall biosynthesis